MHSWVEQDPLELFQNVLTCLKDLQPLTNDLLVLAGGITNQRETIVSFRKSTGTPLANAISWMDTRTSSFVETLKLDTRISSFENKTGLKASTFFSAPKICWLLQNNSNVQQAAIDQDLAFCTIDSWILWKLTIGGSFFTDPSNASRTFLYNLKDSHENSLKWDSELLDYFGIQNQWLPEIRATDFGSISTEFPFSNLPITALIGDQQASLIGHWGKDFFGKSKCTLGTGAFLLHSLNIGTEIINSNCLLTLIQPGQFAEEFPIVCAGSLVTWLLDSLNLIASVDELYLIDFNATVKHQQVAESVYFVPNLSGCLFPLWNPKARGSFHNISLQTNKYDMILAVLESIAFSIRRALENVKIEILSIDGGMSLNFQFCQLLANVTKRQISTENNTCICFI